MHGPRICMCDGGIWGVLMLFQINFVPHRAVWHHKLEGGGGWSYPAASATCLNSLVVLCLIGQFGKQ